MASMYALNADWIEALEAAGTAAVALKKAFQTYTVKAERARKAQQAFGLAYRKSIAQGRQGTPKGKALYRLSVESFDTSDLQDEIDTHCQRLLDALACGPVPRR